MSDEFNADEFLSGIGIDPEEGATDTLVIKLLRKQLKENGKQLKAANERVAAYEAEKAKAAVTSVWDELGVPEPIRGFYRGDQDADAIQSWWNDSKPFFNVQGEPAPAPTQRQELSAVQQAQNLAHDSQSLGLDAFNAKAAEVRKTSPNRTPHALADLFKTLNIPAGETTVPRVQ